MSNGVKSFGHRFPSSTARGGMKQQPGQQASAGDDDPSFITPAYKIGAIARLTGLSTHTLRKWEDRYAVVEPSRTEGGDRIYTRDDLRRLALIKDLIDAGQSIGKIARLSTEDLERACDDLHGPLSGPQAATLVNGQVHVAVAGDALPGMLAHQVQRLERLEFVAAARNVDELCDMLKTDGEPARVDVLLMECPSLQPNHRRSIHEMMKRVGARAAVVIYSFGSRRVVSAARGRSVALLRAPMEPEELQRTILGLMLDVNAPRATVTGDLMSGEIEPPAPRFEHSDVVEIAARATSIECECPRHLSDLWLSLTAFEDYSKDCEATAPDDVALHKYLRRTTGQARALIEAALERTARADGILS